MTEEIKALVFFFVVVLVIILDAVIPKPKGKAKSRIWKEVKMTPEQEKAADEMYETAMSVARGRGVAKD